MRNSMIGIIAALGILLLLAGGRVLAQVAMAQELAALTKAGTPFLDGDRLLFLGDGITEAADSPSGYLSLLRAAFQAAPHPQLTLINAGVDADMVPDLQARLQGAIDNHPNLVFIQIGVGDAWRTDWGGGVKPEVYEAGLRDIIGKLQAQGITVVLATPTLNGELLNGANKYDKSLDDYAAISRKVALELHVGLCDLRKAFVDYLTTHNPDNKDSGILTTDGRQLSDAGNALLAQEAAKSLLAAFSAGPLPLAHGGEFVDATTATLGYRPGDPVTADTALRYTLDGTEPTLKSPTYTAPLPLTKTTTVKMHTFVKEQPIGVTLTTVYSRMIPREPDVLKNPVHGVNYNLYEGGGWPNMPDLTTLTPVASGTLTAPDLTPRKHDENFSMLFTGFIEVPSYGMYTFTTTSDDGSRMWIGDRLVVNNDGQHGMTPVDGHLLLKPGKHAFTIGFMQGGGGFGLEVRYAGPNLPQQLIPATAYWREGEAPAAVTVASPDDKGGK